MPYGVSKRITVNNNIEENFSPFLSGPSAGFCAPPALSSSENEDIFEAIPENTELCTPDPSSPYAQKLFAENPAAPVSAPSAEGKIEPIKGEATGCAETTGGSLVEGFYVFMGTLSFLYRLLS